MEEKLEKMIISTQVDIKTFRNMQHYSECEGDTLNEFIYKAIIKYCDYLEKIYSEEE